MKKTTKKLIAVLLTFCILLSSFITAFATSSTSDDYAIYQDSSAATTNYDTYFHVYDYSTYGSAEKVVPAGEYKVTLDVYAQSIGTLAYKPIKDWADAGEQLYWTPTEDDLNKWVTVTFAGTTTSEANLHSLIYVAGFKGYVDNITVYTGETELYKLSFTESDNGKAGHDNNGAGVVTALPQDIADAKLTDEPAPTKDYTILVDNSANSGFGNFYLHELGMSHDKTYPIGDYTIKFDYYPLVNGSSKNIVAHLTATGWSGDAFPGTNGQKWLEVSETLGEWQTISFDITTIAEGQFPWFYIGAGMKGYFDNYQIIDKSTGETVLDFSPVEADLGKTSKETATVVEFVEPDYVVLVDNSTNGGFGQFYLHEVGMSHDKTYPIGDYTIKFDYYPLANGSSKNIVAHLTATGWSGDAFPGTNGQKWLEVSETLGEWQTISFDITTIAEGQFPWFYIGAGMKGYFDNYQIIDKSTGETVLDFSPKASDLGKTSKETATVVEFEEVHFHTAAAAVIENITKPTCTVSSTYDEVVYCETCGDEISRNTVTNDMLLVDTTANDNNTAKDFWFNELGMSGYGALANGTYTIQFDVYPVTIPDGGNLFHYRTSSGNGPSSNTGWWKPEFTVGEWTTTSSTFTVTDDTTTGNHILFIYGGFKGCVDNIVILDASGNEVAGTYTGITGLTVPEKHKAYLTVSNKLAHTAGEAVRENEKAATCTEAGSYDEVVYCSVCDEELSRTTKAIDILDHTAGEAVRENEVAATCSAAGSYEEVVYCSVCDKELSRTTKAIDILDHTEGEAVRENEEAATCINAGSYDEVVYCTECGGELSRTTETIDKLPHTEGEAVHENEVAATCKLAGSFDKVVYCTECGEELSRTTETIDKLPHTEGEAVAENRVESTCTTAGSYESVVYCTVCSEVISKDTIALELNPDAHVYDNENDVYCNECGEKNPLVEDIVFSIANTTATIGDEFEVVVSIDNNTGIISAKLDIGYDSDVLELVSVKGGDFAKTLESAGEAVDCYNFGELTANPFAINWTSPLSEDVTTNGTFAVLTFKVKDSAKAGDTTVTINCDPDNIFNSDLVNVEFKTDEATITVKNNAGDVNNDGEINNKDLGLLMQYINGWNVTVNEELSDVNIDGAINNKDYALIARYINGWDIALG